MNLAKRLAMKTTASSAEWAHFVKTKRRELEWTMETLCQEAGIARGTLQRLEKGQVTSKTVRERVRDTISRELKRRAEALKEIANGR